MNALVEEVQQEMRNHGLVGAKLISETVFPHFGNEEAILRLGSLILRFERDRDFDNVEIGSAYDPEKFYYFCDLCIAFNWQKVEEAAKIGGPEPLEIPLKLLFEKVGVLEEVFAAENLESTRAKLKIAAKLRRENIMEQLDVTPS